MKNYGLLTLFSLNVICSAQHYRSLLVKHPACSTAIAIFSTLAGRHQKHHEQRYHHYNRLSTHYYSRSFAQIYKFLFEFSPLYPNKF